MCHVMDLDVALSNILLCVALRLIGLGISVPQSAWISLHLLLCLAAEGMGGGSRLVPGGDDAF